MRRRSKFLTVAGALLCVFLLAGESRSDAAVEKFVANLAESLRSLRIQTEAAEGHGLERCHTLMKRMVELDVMARTAAADIWERMNASQRLAFQAGFEARMAANCVRAIRDYDGEAIWLAGVRRAGDHEQLATVRVGLTAGGERMVTWRLRNFSGRIRAVDVIADGRSVVAAERNGYAAFLQSNDDSLDALIANLAR